MLLVFSSFIMLLNLVDQNKKYIDSILNTYFKSYKQKSRTHHRHNTVKIQRRGQILDNLFIVFYLQ